MSNNNSCLLLVNCCKDEMYLEEIMDREMLRQVQLVQLEIAKEVKRICDENNIKYFLSNGTLLGAVRHGGFIPWDDDLDIGFMRNEYDKFLEIASTCLSEKYFIQTWDSDSYYPNSYAKIRKKNTIYMEKTAQTSKAHNEIYIDIFPYDILPSNEKKKKKQGMLLDFYKFVMLAKSKYKPWRASEKFLSKCKLYVVYLPFRILSVFMNRECVKKNYNSVITRHNKEHSGNVYEASVYGGWVVPASCFDTYKELKFEEVYFSCPGNSELYLESVYGDYMTLPPEDQRENRHNIIQVKL